MTGIRRPATAGPDAARHSIIRAGAREDATGALITASPYLDGSRERIEVRLEHASGGVLIGNAAQSSTANGRLVREQ